MRPGLTIMNVWHNDMPDLVRRQVDRQFDRMADQSRILFQASTFYPTTAYTAGEVFPHNAYEPEGRWAIWGNGFLC